MNEIFTLLRIFVQKYLQRLYLINFWRNILRHKFDASNLFCKSKHDQNFIILSSCAFDALNAFISVIGALMCINLSRIWHFNYFYDSHVCVCQMMPSFSKKRCSIIFSCRVVTFSLADKFQQILRKDVCKSSIYVNSSYLALFANKHIQLNIIE